ncbi:unnamed protein product [Ceutorhynchus assimilis]|uniref:Dynein light chain n=1 Tax=Ceutorhynchus assimilis TaxID=467358 RepID=A0A9N9MH68_9CUCU|nr:unnamed protein product [Ceutorhynchus assimilis]
MDEENAPSVDPKDAFSTGIVSQVDHPKFSEKGKELSHESVAPQNSYQIKPSFQDTFKEAPVKEVVINVQQNTLYGQTYDADSAKKWTIRMANEINEKIKDIGMKRFRHVVQVIIGERKGQGVKSGIRCTWDSETDTCSSEVFMNDTIFCVITVFAVFHY